MSEMGSGSDSDESSTRSSDLRPAVDPGTPDDRLDQALIDTEDGFERIRPSPRPVPEQVSRYRVLGLLGRGGMGIVLDAFDPELDRRVAVKLLRPERVGFDAPQRLLREAKAMARLSHPNVVQVYDAGLDDGQVFVAMEQIEGCSGRTWLEEQPRRWPQVLELFVQAGRGLEVAHAAGIVHRDFKLDNVLVADDGRVCVADFGVALDDRVHSTPPEQPQSPATTDLTRTGATVGTPLYMAPEQHAGSRVGPAADQFSYCVALHTALYGQRPFGGDTAGSIARATMQGRYVEPLDSRGVPPWLAAVVRRGLQIDPDDRFASMTALLEALQSDPTQARRRWIRRIALATLGLGGASAAWFVGARADAPCSGAEARLAQAWSSDAAATVRDRLAPDDAAAVLANIDAYADGWSTRHRAQCEAHRRGELSTPLFDASMACLERRHQALSAYARTLVDEQPPEHTIGPNAAALPSLSRCDDRRWLASATPAAKPDQRVALATLQDRQAHATALHDAGHIEAALTELDAIESELQAVAHEPASARFALLTGRLASERGDFDSASTRLRTAFEAGLAHRLELVAVEALARLVFVRVQSESRPQAALDQAGTLQALLTGADAPADLRALAANNLGAVHGVLGDVKRAREYLESATDIASESTLVRPSDRSGYLRNLALITEDAAARNARFEASSRIARALYGPGHPLTQDIAVQQALHRDDPRRAQTQLEQLCGRLGGSESCHECFYELGELTEQSGDIEAAARAMDEASECRPPTGRPYDRALALKARAYASFLRGHRQESRRALQSARTTLSPHAELRWVARDLADLQLLDGRMDLADGSHQVAKTKLTAARAAFEKEFDSTRQRAPRRRAAQIDRLLSDARFSATAVPTADMPAEDRSENELAKPPL